MNKDPFDEHFARVWSGEVLDPTLSAIFGNDSLFPHIDDVTVYDALVGFRLNPEVPHEWLALAVRRSLARVTPDPARSPNERPGPKEARNTLQSLAEKARSLAAEIDNLPLDIAAPLSQKMDATSFRQFSSWLEGCRSLSNTLDAVARDITVTPGAWRASEAKKLREAQAHSLIPVFKTAFGLDATITDPRDYVPNSGGKWPDFKLGAFPDFFARMINLACEVELTRDQLRDATKAARTKFKLAPFEHPYGIIPRPPE